MGFAPSAYTVACGYDGWAGGSPSTFRTFGLTVDASGSASRSGPCFINFAKLTGNGLYLAVSKDSAEVARSGWLK